MRHAAKIDANQRQIVEGLRKLGAGVHSTAQLGKGSPDILVWFAGRYLWFEVKVPGKSLNEKQQAFHAAWPGRIHVVSSLEEARNILYESRAQQFE